MRMKYLRHGYRYISSCLDDMYGEETDLCLCCNCFLISNEYGCFKRDG